MIQHTDEKCRCTIKRFYCEGCLIKWYDINERIICPICREYDKYHDRYEYLYGQQIDNHDAFTDINLSDIFEIENINGFVYREIDKMKKMLIWIFLFICFIFFNEIIRIFVFYNNILVY